MNRRIFRCRIARLVAGQLVQLSYLGPIDRIPAGWSLVMRRAERQAKAVLA